MDAGKLRDVYKRQKETLALGEELGRAAGPGQVYTDVYKRQIYMS